MPGNQIGDMRRQYTGVGGFRWAAGRVLKNPLFGSLTRGTPICGIGMCCLFDGCKPLKM
jgi:hypothetical protein